MSSYILVEGFCQSCDRNRQFQSPCRGGRSSSVKNRFTTTATVWTAILSNFTSQLDLLREAFSQFLYIAVANCRHYHSDNVNVLPNKD